jgi:hypothetical protein
LAESSFNEISVIGFKGAQAGVEELAFGNDDDVEPLGDLVSTKDLSNQSFGSISLNRSADLPGCGDPEPSHPVFVGQDKDRAVAAVDANTPLVHLLEFRATTDVFGRTESHTTT